MNAPMSRSYLAPDRPFDGGADGLGAVNLIIGAAIAVATVAAAASRVVTGALTGRGRAHARRTGLTWLERGLTHGLLGGAVLIAGRDRAWRKEELLAELAYSRRGAHPSRAADRLRHAAGVVSYAVQMRSRDIRHSRPAALTRHLAQPAVPSLSVVLVLMVYYAAGRGFAGIMGHPQELEAAGFLTGIIEAALHSYRRHRK